MTRPTLTWRTAWRRFRRDDTGVSAIEFAMLSPAFLAIMSMAFYTGYYYYCTAGLAYAVETAARHIVVGDAQNAGVTTAQNFVNTYVCPTLSPMMNCSNVIVIAKHVTPAYNYDYAGVWGDAFLDWPNGLKSFPMDNSQTPFCIGGPKALIGLVVYYAMPFPGASATYKGNPVIFVNSNAAFRNEPFTSNFSC